MEITLSKDELKQLLEKQKVRTMDEMTDRAINHLNYVMANYGNTTEFKVKREFKDDLNRAFHKKPQLTLIDIEV